MRTLVRLYISNLLETVGSSWIWLSTEGLGPEMEGCRISRSGCQGWRYELGFSCARYIKGRKCRRKITGTAAVCAVRERWQPVAVMLLSPQYSESTPQMDLREKVPTCGKTQNKPCNKIPRNPRECCTSSLSLGQMQRFSFSGEIDILFNPF